MPQKDTFKDVVSRTTSKEVPPKNPPVEGNNYLFVIAIDAYTICPRLYNCVRDAKQLISVLTEKYNFQQKHTYTLFDKEATERKIFSTFRTLAKRITPADNLIIFFSGHGEYDKVFGEGYWIPIDAKEGAQEDYIANSKIKTFLNAIPSLHTFLIVDSCFSGSLFTQFKNATLAERLATAPSRWGLTAGRNEIVADGQAGTNSPFAEMLIYQLKQATTPLGVANLCNRVVETVIANADQTPRGEPLKINGHRGGQFFFWPKGYTASSSGLEPAQDQPQESPKKSAETNSTPKPSIYSSITSMPKCSIYVSVTLMAIVGVLFFLLPNQFTSSPNKTDSTVDISNDGLGPEPPPMAIEEPAPPEEEVKTTLPTKDNPRISIPTTGIIKSPSTPDVKENNPPKEESNKPVPFVLQKASKGGKYGYKDANSGGWIVPPQYKLVTAFSGGLAAVQDFNFKWGYINEQGVLVIPHLIDQPTKFGNKNRVQVMINSEWVTINKKGKVQVGSRIMDLKDFLNQ